MDERNARLKRQCAYQEILWPMKLQEKNLLGFKTCVYKEQIAQHAVLKVVNAQYLQSNETAPLIHPAMLKDKVVKEKMDKFHHKMSKIKSTICIVCSDKFPGTKMASLSTTCTLCYRDKAVLSKYKLPHK